MTSLATVTAGGSEHNRRLLRDGAAPRHFSHTGVPHAYES